MTELQDMVRAIVRETIAELLPHLRADDELMTLEAASAVVHTTPRHIRDAGRRGELDVVRVGRSPRVRRSSLLAWARPVAQRVDVAADPRAVARASIAAAAARAGGR